MTLGSGALPGRNPGRCACAEILGDGVKLGIHSLGIDFDAELFRQERSVTVTSTRFFRYK